MEKERFFYAVTSSVTAPDKAALPLVLASTALDSGHDVIVWFATEGALLARKGAAARIFSPVFGNLEELLKKVIHQGGRVAVCGTCCNFYRIPDDELAEGVEKRTALWAVEASTGRNCLTF